ncbi:MAG: hypothetical protein ACRDOK_12470 [Streptosporangiaceae bacterium]
MPKTWPWTRRWYPTTEPLAASRRFQAEIPEVTELVCVPGDQQVAPAIGLLRICSSPDRPPT